MVSVCITKMCLKTIFEGSVAERSKLRMQELDEVKKREKEINN